MSHQNSKTNPQITDAVTTANVLNLGMAPAMSMGSLYNTMANNVAMASMNAVMAQQQAWVAHQAATVAGVAQIYAAIKGGS